MLHRLVYICIFLLPLNLWASHNRGGEITYIHLGGLTYEITITTCADPGIGEIKTQIEKS